MTDVIINEHIAFFKQLNLNDKVALISQLTSILNNDLNKNSKNNKQEREDVLTEFLLESQSEEEKLATKKEQLMQDALADLSIQEQQRYEYLMNRMNHGNISKVQKTELNVLVQKSEQLNVQRMNALAKLSELNNVSIEESMKQLELRKKEKERAIIDELSKMWKDEDNLTAETIINRTYSDREISFDD